MRRVEASLAAAGFRLSRDSVAGRQAVIGRTSRLRRRTFVLVAVFKDCTRDHLDRFLAEAAQYAAAVTGGVRGARVVAVAVAQSTLGAGDWSATGDTAQCLPVLVEVGRGAVSYAEGVGSLQQLVRDLVVPAVGS